MTAHWDQRDNAGQPVPAGNYFVRVTYDVGPPTIHPLVLGGTDAGVVLEGTAVIQETLTGESRHFSLCAPLDAGFPYVLLASLTADVGIPTCAGTFPLDPDALFTLSLTAGAVFQSSTGMLGPTGTTTAPVFDLPPNPNLIGLSLELSLIHISEPTRPY